MKQTIEKQLASLGEIRASGKLQEKIQTLTHELPHMGYVGGSLFAFRLVLATLVLLLLTGLTTGVGLAANGSHPGSILFPVKKIIVQTQMHFAASEKEKATLEQQLQLSPNPTATPTPVDHKDEKENEKEKEDTSPKTKNDEKRNGERSGAEIEEHTTLRISTTPLPSVAVKREETLELDK